MTKQHVFTVFTVSTSPDGGIWRERHEFPTFRKAATFRADALRWAGQVSLIHETSAGIPARAPGHWPGNV